MNELDPKDIKAPGRKLALDHGATERDYHAGQERMGGIFSRPPDLFPNEDCSPHLVNFVLQHNKFFDDYSCVTHAAERGEGLLRNFQFKDTRPFSVRRVAVDSGTQPKLGNSVNAPLEQLRTKGTELEATCPTITPTMTEDEYFKLDPMKPENEIFLSSGYALKHEWVKNPLVSQCTLDEACIAIKRGPVMISVDGTYHYNQQGQLDLLGQEPHYDHEVLLVKAIRDDQGNLLYALVADSENPNGLMKISPNYLPGYAKILFLFNEKKKNMLVKTLSSPAVYLFVASSGNYFPISDGSEITGGDLLKTMSGTYANANIKIVDYIPQDRIKGSVKQND